MLTRLADFVAYTLFAFGAGTLTVQAGTSLQTVQSPQVKIEPSNGMTIENLLMRPRPGQWLVSGRVKRGFGRAWLIGSHVCLVVRNTNRTLLESEELRLTPSWPPKRTWGLGRTREFFHDRCRSDGLHNHPFSPFGTTPS